MISKNKLIINGWPRKAEEDNDRVVKAIEKIAVNERVSQFKRKVEIMGEAKCKS